MLKKKNKEYKKLIHKRSSYAHTSVFVSKDHFLIASAKAYQEDYNRFFYDDIAALKIRVSKWQKLIMIIISICTVISGSIFAISLNDPTFAVVTGIIFGIFLIYTVVVLIQGPQSILVIKTLTTEKEFPVGRLRFVKKVINKMRPFIEEAQGKVTPEVLEALQGEKVYKA